MARYGLCGPSYKAISQNFDDEIADNWICEISGSQNAKTTMGMFSAPGRKEFADLVNETSVPEDFTLNGRMFAAASHFYEIDAAGNVTDRGALNGQPLSKPMIRANETQLLILSNGDLFIFTLATNILTAVNMAQFNGPVQQIEFCDGYFLATIQNSHTFQQSNLEDGTTWDGLNIATISLFPDNFTSMGVSGRNPVFYSLKKFAVYYNAGAGFPVFIPISNALGEDGAGATFATTKLDNTLFWLDEDERGAFVARRLSGATGERVSTHATELAWQSYTTPSDAIGWTYQENGHTYWMLRFVAQNETWGYDVASGLWHQRSSFNENFGIRQAERATCHAYCFGKHLVGDWASGKIYEQSSKYNTDDGHMIVRTRRSPTISKENEWIYFSEARFDIETGLSPTADDIAMWTAVYGTAPLLDGNGVSRPVQMILRWSNDGGRTWSNDRILSLRFPGEFGKLVRKTMLGRGRNRLWEIVLSDPIPAAIADGFVYGGTDYQPSERLSDQMRKVS